jgi:hypothetical protein
MSNGDVTPAAQGPSASPSGPTVDASARYQARVALVTAIVALVSAILGPLVSLKINSDQIDSQTRQFKLEAATNTAQSEGEFVRTQRSTAYTDFLTAFNNGTLDLLGAAGAFAGAGADAQGLNDQLDKALTAVKDVTATYYKVQIVASDDSDESARALYQEFGQWSGSLLVAGAKVVGGEPLTADEQALLEGTSEEYETLLGLSNDFIADGRDDFNVDRADEAGDS